VSLGKFGGKKLHTACILGLLFSVCLQFRQVLNMQQNTLHDNMHQTESVEAATTLQ